MWTKKELRSRIRRKGLEGMSTDPKAGRKARSLWHSARDSPSLMESLRDRSLSIPDGMELPLRVSRTSTLFFFFALNVPRPDRTA